LPFETLISQTQQDYYNALGKSDREGNSTNFIEYMLDVIDKSLIELLNFNNRILSDIDRLEYFIALGKKEFSRKDYMNVFKDISTATASRDLKKGIELKMFEKTGIKNKTIYKLTK
jgi:Fic family protein